MIPCSAPLTRHRAPAADFLKIAFEAEWHRGRPLAETLPVCDRIRKALPAVLKIWASGPSTPLQENMQQLARWETRAYTGLLQDRYTLQTPSVSLAPSSLARSLFFRIILEIVFGNVFFALPTAHDMIQLWKEVGQVRCHRHWVVDGRFPDKKRLQRRLFAAKSRATARLRP